MMLSDYRCHEHGVFEALTDGHCDEAPCTVCGALSPWTPSAVSGKVQTATVSTGRSDPRPHPGIMDTRAIADGMPVKEWKRERSKYWRDRRHREGKEL